MQNHCVDVIESCSAADWLLVMEAVLLHLILNGVIKFDEIAPWLVSRNHDLPILNEFGAKLEGHFKEQDPISSLRPAHLCNGGPQNSQVLCCAVHNYFAIRR